jgi:hypothetical protein
MHFATQTGVTEKFLNIEQSNGFFVDCIFAGTVAKEGAGDGDFAVVDGKCPIGVIDGEHDLCSTQRRFGGGASEDDIFHGPTAQGLGALFTHHPGQAINDIGFTGPIGSHDAGDTGFKSKGGRLSEGLKPLKREGFQMH